MQNIWAGERRQGVPYRPVWALLRRALSPRNPIAVSLVGAGGPAVVRTASAFFVPISGGLIAHLLRGFVKIT
ncbi:hypothetical protein KGY64_02475 [Candidatus Bipolaricaulota bacterium]|nr:hypothetical protein [Candidatus Bipolaricaulota bacterium]